MRSVYIQPMKFQNYYKNVSIVSEILIIVFNNKMDIFRYPTFYIIKLSAFSFTFRNYLRFAVTRIINFVKY